MKHLILIITYAFVTLSIKANAVFNLSDFYKINVEYCDIEEGKKGRMLVDYPQLYQSLDYLYVQTEVVYDICIIIRNSQGAVVKEDILFIEPEKENLYYIGDFDSGEYNIEIDFQHILIKGTFVVD